MVGPKRILLVDDDPLVQRVTSLTLQNLGYDVLTACDGEEGLSKAEKERPDLILLDIMMPKLSGFEVCKRVKADPKTRDIIVIMVTALNEPSDIERAAECGTDDYISKPVDRKALVDLVRNLLKARSRT